MICAGKVYRKDDEHSHAADAFRYFAQNMQEQSTTTKKTYSGDSWLG
jgi:hypothetical protein